MTHAQKQHTVIGVFFGSRSPEHDISIITGTFVINELKKLGYTTVPIYLSRSGDWYIGDELGKLSFFKDKDSLDKRLKKYRGWKLSLEQTGVLLFEKAGLFTTTKAKIDIAFPAFHGSFGEDGVAQGMFEMLDVPYVGCGISSSVISMDKVLTKLLLQQYEIPTPTFVYATKEEWSKYEDKILDEFSSLGWPLFVKPPKLGSSIGITKVESKEDLKVAIEAAFHYDTKVLVEKAIFPSKDLTVAVLGNDKPRTSLVQESNFEADFFTYDDKYLNDGGVQLGNAAKNLKIPADIEESVAQEIREMAAEIYKLFECTGTARVDFLYDTNKEKIYANEINPLPGTLYHHLWKESGVKFRDVLETLLLLARRRHAKRRQIDYAFDTPILEQANSQKFGQKLNVDKSKKSSNQLGQKDKKSSSKKSKKDKGSKKSKK